ncbi:hypothetical protein T4E_9190 [Trichinella pseudospiralis]|uniref:Uncharacterized protein n=1 Tax=Trichinella pseudospiralis TaxID=6337 RepID=A0A0V0YEE5_TRIPS|nr:hypothetical protein T4E_9190 [Trichinella pseudospiralis]
MCAIILPIFILVTFFYSAIESSNVLYPGDLLFWSLPTKLNNSNNSSSDESFLDAVIASGNDENVVFHVSIIQNDSTVIHVTTEHGVTNDAIINYCEEYLKNGYPIQLTTMTITGQNATTKNAALEWALSKIGLPYNDIFNENCTNSKGQEAYYCCQFVRKAYENVLGYPIFEIQPLNFNDTTGKLNPYWVDYFKQRNMPVPVDQYGSHPGRLIRSPNLQEIFSMYINDTNSVDQFLQNLADALETTNGTAPNLRFSLAKSLILFILFYFTFKHLF